MSRRKNSKGDTESGEYKTLPMLHQSFYTEGIDFKTEGTLGKGLG